VTPHATLKRHNWRAVHALFRRSSVLLWAAAIFALAAAIAVDDFLRLGLVTAAATLLALVGILRGFATFTDCHRSHDEQVLQQFLDTESAPSILFDPDHVVVWANQSALTAFPNLYEDGMAKGLKTLMPDPASLLRQLQARLGVRDRVSEDVVTRKTHFRAVLHRMGLGRLLLRLEHISEKAADGPSSGAITAVPLMTISAKGTVLSMNEAMRQIVGKRVHHIDRVFPAPLPETGAVALIRTAGGATDRVRVYHTALAGDRREVAVMQDGLGVDAPASGFTADDLPVALLHLGRNGLIIDANEPARALLRLEEGQPFGALGEAVTDLGRSISDWVNEAIEAATPAKPEVVRLQNSAEENFIQISLSAGRHEGVPEVTAVLHDATELKTLEAQFVQGQKMQAIGQLAGGVAHDFNNLLTAISGHCDLLLLRHDQGDGDYADLEQINQNANRASALVGQLLAFSRKQTLLPEVIDLRDTLADLTHLLNRLVGEKMMLSLYHDPDLPTVRADKRQLEQVMMNLVVNARDAMPDGGDITIETRRVVLTEPLKKARAVVPIGEYACIVVCDQGIGIPPDLLTKIFEPFYSTKRVGEGTGLGLSTAYGIVKQSGGFIFVDSNVGKGTEFTLFFPSYHGAVVTPPKVPEQKALSTPKINPGDAVILLVEDEAPVRAFAARALRLRGFTVLEAASAEEALDTLASDGLHVDLFVSDVVMPGMDGPSWVRKARENRPEIRAVFVSGYAEDLHTGSESSMENAVFLPKPFSLQQLTETVQAQLEV